MKDEKRVLGSYTLEFTVSAMTRSHRLFQYSAAPFQHLRDFAGEQFLLNVKSFFREWKIFCGNLGPP